MLLALDTSTAAVTAAVCDDTRSAPGTGEGSDAVVLAARSLVQRNRHAEHLAPLIAAVLDEAGMRPDDLDTVAVGVGPGPFTGLRVGLVTAQVLALTGGAQVVGVCSLDALAQGAVETGVIGPGEELVVATDARRREVYWAGYRVVGAHAGIRVERTEGPEVSAPDAVPRRGRVVAGRGAELYPAALGEVVGPLDVDAAALARLAVSLLRTGRTLPVRPLYLRRPDAAEPGARKRVLS